MRFREIENMIEKDGWYQVKQKGSHHQYKHPTKPGKVTIPEHGGDLNPDTVKSPGLPIEYSLSHMILSVYLSVLFSL